MSISGMDPGLLESEGIDLWLDQRGASFEMTASRSPQDEDFSSCYQWLSLMLRSAERRVSKHARRQCSEFLHRLLRPDDGIVGHRHSAGVSIGTTRLHDGAPQLF